MTLLPTALPRPSQAIAAPEAGHGLASPKAGHSLAVSLLLHALGVAVLIAASLSAPRVSKPARMIEMGVATRPTLPAPIPITPPPMPTPVPARPPTHRTTSASRPQPAPPLQPAPQPPASVRDESALAHADTLAPPRTDTTVTDALPPVSLRAATRGIPGATASLAPSGPSGQSGGSGLKGKLVSVTRLTRMPILTVAAKPEYTAEMQRRNLAGKLKAKVLVDSDGKVKDAVVLADLGYGTREAGLAALRKLEFDPGYADGAAVAVWIPFTFTFEWQE